MRDAMEARSREEVLSRRLTSLGGLPATVAKLEKSNERLEQALEDMTEPEGVAGYEAEDDWAREEAFSERLEVLSGLQKTVAHLEQALAKVTARMMPGAGHMLHHDQPELLARMIEAFLTGAEVPA